MNTAPLARAIGWIAVAVGAVTLLVGAVLGVRTASWYRGTATTVGEVTAHESHASVPRKPVHHRDARQPAEHQRSVSEVVRFTDATGAEHGFTSSMGVSDPFPIGAAVPVRYTPSDPGDASIDTWLRIWGFALIPAVAGACMTGFGAVFLRAGRGRAGG